MHTIALMVAGFITLLLVGVATRNNLAVAWLVTAVSVVPAGLLYLVFRGDGDVMFLWPTFVLLSVTLARSILTLLRVYSRTPHSLNNVTTDGSPHWAS